MSPTEAQHRREDIASIDFLEDWRDDHRPLSQRERALAGSYIACIVARDEAAGDRVVAEALAIELWVHFRELYDGFRGPYARSEAEDFVRALGRI